MSWMTACSVGIVLAAYLPVLPDARLIPLLLPIVLPFAVLGTSLYRLGGFLVLGLLWGCYAGNSLMRAQLPDSMDGTDVTLKGRVVGLPERSKTARGDRWRFLLELENRPWPDAQGRVLITWYGNPVLKPGQRWRMTARLRRPRGFVNPGGFDYQAWLMRRAVVATGYVRSSEAFELLAEGPSSGITPWRYYLQAELTERHARHPRLAQLLAVTIGVREGLGVDDWRLYATTGTTHLMVISGLHVGLVAGLFYGLTRFLVRRRPALLILWPDCKWAALVRLMAAAVYAALAGFSLPTQRAMIMVSVMAIAVIRERVHRPMAGMACALLIVLVLDPLAPTSAGFWLSFLAVGALLMGFWGRLGAPTRLRGLVIAQLLVFCALLPVLGSLGLPVSMLAPAANLLAVPLVGFIIVPLALLGTFLTPLIPILADGVVSVALMALDVLQTGLAALRQLCPDPVLVLPHLHALLLAPLALASVLLFGPGSLGLRSCGALIGAATLLLVGQADPGLVELLVLDVGQGQAVIVRTQQHTLVFDAGPSYGSKFEAGSGIIAPALRWSGVNEVDLLVISHSDNDHAGGLPGLLKAVKVNSVLSSEIPPGKFDVARRRCRAGQRWQWDGVTFSMLHPREEHAEPGNNGSCVLAIQAGDKRILLTGDIEAAAEQSLLSRVPGALPANVMLAPHHGSRTSSTRNFVEAVQPDFVLVSAGWNNRYGHPHPDVLDRFRDVGATVLETGRGGALRVRVTRDGDKMRVERWRDRRPRYWRQ